MLSVGDIAALPGLGLSVAAGRGALGREVGWLHVSELADPTVWLEGGELLLTTGLGIGDTAESQRAYVRRLAAHDLAGLGFGVGFDYDEVPRALAAEAERLEFPVLSIPYEVPFVAITKAAFTRIAAERLEQLTEALAVHELLVDAVLRGRGLSHLLEILGSHLDCSLRLVDDAGRVLGERHGRTRLPFDEALELPVNGDEPATLAATRNGAGFGDYDRLVLHHGQTAIAFELSRRRAVSAAELRLAGDLLDDLEGQVLDEREASRRIAAFGLRPQARYAALFAVPRDGESAERLRRTVAEELDRRTVHYLSTALPDRAAFLVEAGSEQEVLSLAREVLEAAPEARIGVGRPAQGTELAQSLVEARAALSAGTDDVASYRDLGSLELLLALPTGALEAFVARVLGGAVERDGLLESLRGLLDTGCRWSEAAERLGIHRHTLRYRMDRLRELTGRHPDDPAQRMELWLAVKASEALSARNGERVA
ncbi:MAG TPA: PucR family transcriptional regulator ligand-binding domain-containing protein [Gaiellaceae bacterium]|jgi:purine catabolism regulator|nr:PucR family transcriptional regulator ligand-binding domain-containing protein [Gaiellaceae bacterium]